MNIVKELKKITDVLQNAPSPAYICGGAIRDVEFGKLPKDIDIFCTYTDDQEIQPMIDYFCEYMERGAIGGMGGEYEEAINDIHSVHDFKWDTGEVQRIDVGFRNIDVIDIPQILDVQLVFLKANADKPYLQHIFDSFDLTICQAGMYYDGVSSKYKIVKSESFKHNRQLGYFCLTPFGKTLSREQSEKTRNRAQKIGQKLGVPYVLNFDYQEAERRERMVRQQREYEVMYREAMRQMNQEQLWGRMNQWYDAGIHQRIPPLQRVAPVRQNNHIWQDVNEAFNLGNGRR